MLAKNLSYLKQIQTNNDYSTKLKIVLPEETILLKTVYLPPDTRGNQYLHELLQNLEESDDYILLIGDFNARLEKGQTISLSATNFETRATKDKTINSRGKTLLAKADEVGMCVINGTKAGNRNGEFTFRNNNGASTIDLSLCSTTCAN
jgi:hypothetical protein